MQNLSREAVLFGVATHFCMCLQEGLFSTTLEQISDVIWLHIHVDLRDLQVDHFGAFSLISSDDCA